MPRYHVNKQVPWAEILRVLRWHLEMRIRGLRDDCNKPNIIPECALRRSRERLQTSFNAYLALRAFLGCTSPTAVQASATAALELVKL